MITGPDSCFPHDPPRRLGVHAGEPEVDGVALGAAALGEAPVVALGCIRGDSFPEFRFESSLLFIDFYNITSYALLLKVGTDPSLHSQFFP